ncbi:MAG: anti-sigma factor family protein [Actinomycetota bacterium]
MNCPKVQPLLSELLDGDLDAERTGAVERHLAQCPACAAEWRSLRATVRLVGHLGRQECPVDLRAAVLQSVAHTPARRPGPSFLQRAMAVTVGGSAVLACLSLPLVLQRASLQGGRSFTGILSQSVPVSMAPVHTEYDMATVLGPTDGLLLAVPARSAGSSKANGEDEAR